MPIWGRKSSIWQWVREHMAQSLGFTVRQRWDDGSCCVHMRRAATAPAAIGLHNIAGNSHLLP